MLIALKLFLGKSVWVPYQMKIKFYLACKCHLLGDRLVTWCVKQLTFNSRWLPVHLSLTLSFLSVSSLRLWMSSSGFNEVYGSCLRTFSGSYLYPSLCGRHLEWEKRVSLSNGNILISHPETRFPRYMTDSQSNVIWIGTMSLVWKDHLSLDVFVFFSLLLSLLVSFSSCGSWLYFQLRWAALVCWVTGSSNI